MLNREEAVTVGGGNWHDIHDLINKLHELGPKIVVLTDGPNGAYASDSENRFRMPLYPDPAPPVERTGAGDSFAGGFMGYLAKCNDISQASLRRAVIYGSAMGSFAVEKFSIERLLEVTPAQLSERVADFRKLVAFEEEL